MSRIRSRHSSRDFYQRPPLPRKSDFQQSSAPNDYYPLSGDHDHRALLAEQLRRDRELTDLPDIARDDFETAAEYEQWLAEGAQRFSA